MDITNSDLSLFSRYGSSFLHTVTGLLVTESDLRPHFESLQKEQKAGSRYQSKDTVSFYESDKWGKIPKGLIYDYRNSIERLQELLGVNDKKLDQLLKIYSLADNHGVFGTSPEARKLLGVNYPRTISSLVAKDWLKKIEVPLGYPVKSTTGSFWMINPDFTTCRDVWSAHRAKHLYAVYEYGEMTTYRMTAKELFRNWSDGLRVIGDPSIKNNSRKKE